MKRYFIDLDGAAQDDVGTAFASVNEARNAAISLLGSYLQSHPSYAFERHWRVDVRDSERRLLLHVIVATVDAPHALNIASFEEPVGVARITRAR